VPLIGRLIHDFAAPAMVVRILHHPADIQRDPLQQSVIVLHNRLHLAAAPQGIFTGQEQFKIAITHGSHGQGGLVPAVHVAHQIDAFRCRGPLPVHPAALYPMEAVIQVTVGEIQQLATLRQQFLLLDVVVVHAQFNIRCERFQIRIIVKDPVRHTGHLFLFFPFKDIRMVPLSELLGLLYPILHMKSNAGSPPQAWLYIAPTNRNKRSIDTARPGCYTAAFSADYPALRNHP